MITKVEIDRDGNKVAVYHRTEGGQKAWTHPYDEKANCKECEKNK